MSADTGDVPPQEEQPGDTPAVPAEAPWKWRKLGPAGFLGLAWAVLPALLGGLLLVRLGTVGDWLAEDRTQGLLIYTLLFALTAGLGLLPTYAQAVLGGWVFGFVDGTAAALVGFTLAALLGFLIARLVARESVQAALAHHPRASAIRAGLLDRGTLRSTGVVALLRLPPNSPFALANLAFSSSGVAIVPFLVGTLIGMAPRTAVATGFAHAGATSGARDLQSFVSDGPGWWVLVAGLVLFVIVFQILARLAQGALERAGLAQPQPKLH